MWGQNMDSVLLVGAFLIRIVLWFSDSMASAPHRLAQPGGAEAETALFLPSEPRAAAPQATAGGSARAKTPHGQQRQRGCRPAAAGQRPLTHSHGRACHTHPCPAGRSGIGFAPPPRRGWHGVPEWGRRFSAGPGPEFWGSSPALCSHLPAAPGMVAGGAWAPVAVARKPRRQAPAPQHLMHEAAESAPGRS